MQSCPDPGVHDEGLQSHSPVHDAATHPDPGVHDERSQSHSPVDDAATDSSPM